VTTPHVVLPGLVGTFAAVAAGATAEWRDLAPPPDHDSIMLFLGVDQPGELTITRIDSGSRLHVPTIVIPAPPPGDEYRIKLDYPIVGVLRVVYLNTGAVAGSAQLSWSYTRRRSP
jgi:hypothetical protein